MAVDVFTREQFEQALPKHKVTNVPLCQCMGMEEGELTYFMPIDDTTGIIIRSSIDSTGYSADTGQDSIRAWLVDCQSKPLGSKVSKWTTRLPGWSERLKQVLRTLWSWRKKAGNCKHCNQPSRFSRSKNLVQTKVVCSPNAKHALHFISLIRLCGWRTNG